MPMNSTHVEGWIYPENAPAVAMGGAEVEVPVVVAEVFRMDWLDAREIWFIVIFLMDVENVGSIAGPRSNPRIKWFHEAGFHLPQSNIHHIEHTHDYQMFNMMNWRRSHALRRTITAPYWDRSDRRRKWNDLSRTHHSIRPPVGSILTALPIVFVQF